MQWAKEGKEIKKNNILLQVWNYRDTRNLNIDLFMTIMILFRTYLWLFVLSLLVFLCVKKGYNPWEHQQRVKTVF